MAKTWLYGLLQYFIFLLSLLLLKDANAIYRAFKNDVK